MENKRDFVKYYLEPMCKIINSDVLKLEYVKATPSYEEYVNVWYEWGDGFNQKQCFRKQINVTADSLLAIAQDVLKRI